MRVLFVKLRLVVVVVVQIVRHLLLVGRALSNGLFVGLIGDVIGGFVTDEALLA